MYQIFNYLCIDMKSNTNYKVMAYNVSEIAKKVISKTHPEYGDVMTNMKLQKMLYYLQGFNLAFLGKPLFEEEIEAWMYGPVVPSVYEEYKCNGSTAIMPEEGFVPISLSEEEENIFDQVYENYGQFSATKLMEMTHKEAPWACTTPGIGNIISKDAIKSYFITQIEN